MWTVSLVSINLHGLWPRKYKRFIEHNYMILKNRCLFLTNPIELHWNHPSGKKCAKWRKVCAPYNLPHSRSFYYNSFNVKRSKLLLANFVSVTKNRKEEIHSRGWSAIRDEREKKRKNSNLHTVVFYFFSFGVGGGGCGRYLFLGVFIQEMTISLGICSPFDNNVPWLRKTHPMLNLNQ